MTVPFDTLDYARKLQHAGVPTEQADEQARVLAEVLAKSVGDLLSLERNLAVKINAMELNLESKLAVPARDLNLLKCMTGFVIAIEIAILAKLFVH